MADAPKEVLSARAATAKAALEQVCSGALLSAAPEFYSVDFVDHVNGTTFRGHEGIRCSVQRYAKVLSNLHIAVKDQIATTDRVTSRFTVTARCYGREVSFDGMTMSRFSGDTIVEDWSVTDVYGMLKQVGPWRSLLIAIRG